MQMGENSLSVSEGFMANITGLPSYKGCRGILSILQTLRFLNSEDFFSGSDDNICFNPPHQ